MTALKRLLVPLDGSALAERALPLAITLAQKFDSEIILLRVVEFTLPAHALYPENHWAREAMQYSYREAQTYLDAQQTELVEQGVRVRTLVRETSPAEDILFIAAQEAIDLIVMSSHGKGSPSPWTSGSVADKVMQHSPCPVLLVRQSPEQTKE